ncbi:sulfate/molybdate ABC transporter ATP-binding protein [Paracraurococcus lichenis]|uniref:ATP-binding cassette domain-containing protein n=1 Tax=Paracraurococcus lichenis TaxID=3064888 RepID=A0ABT9E333_9PROT|nr:ATP-binding cassette domain-containing protein [Paracraurococcus sp. LOR1-02]MDO9710575.1 ATP-binding cassette domain-containing protein [Paracraurococcus sp. LOR1-02]
MTVSVGGLVRRFGPTAALDGVSLEIAEGEFVAVLGPSGSGKSTLLRVLAGLDGSEAGEVRIAGRVMTGVPARERGIGVVFQNYALFRHMTVFENVAFGLRVRPRALRPGRAEVARRVRELLELVQIPELERRYPDQVSGGQRQRVALARALAIEPRLLLLDEPFGALDALVRREVRRWLRGLHDRIGLTTILVTHDQEEAMELADRVAVLERGRVVQFDPPAMLLSAPATPFVAGFVGEVARLSGMVCGGVLRFAVSALPPLRVELPDGPATAFLRPREAEALPGPGGAAIRLLRATAEGELRAVVEAGGVTLDTLLAPDPPGWAARGAPCRLRIASAQVFGADGARALARPHAAEPAW